MRIRYTLGVCMALAVVASGCSSPSSEDGLVTAAVAETVTSTAAATTTTPPTFGDDTSTSTVASTVPVESEGIDRGLMVASDYLVASAARNLEDAMSYLSESVRLDWGAAGTPEELEAAWAWEDAFTVGHTLESCEYVDREPASKVTARCRLLVESEVAAAAGHEPRHVCVEIGVDDGLITEVVGLDGGEECPISYWGFMFVPFSDWLAEAHPEITVQQMYDDRTSPEGLRLWSEYTQEYLNDHDN